MSRLRVFGVVAALFSLVSMASVRAQIVAAHIYELNGSLADANGGPSLVQNGGTLGTNGLSFGAGEGPNLSNALLDAGNYSIEMAVLLDQTNGYRRLIDFKNLTSDTGLYNLNTSLNFYNVVTGAAGVFQDGVLTQVIVTRDGTTNEFVGYVNGVQQISFSDTGGLGIFNQANNIIHFVRDDNAVANEQTSGFLDSIRIYDNVLSQADVTERYGAFTALDTPEPGTWVLLLTGGLGGFFVIRRRFK